MKVILLTDIYKQGVAGEIVEVADGYARNYLIPTKRAAKATPQALKQAVKLRQQADARRAAYENKLNELARQIDGVELVFGRRAASTGKLFGSVTTAEIADGLNEKTGIDINRRRISQQPLREVGVHEVPVRLGTEISPVLRVVIVREEELADYLAATQGSSEDAEAENPVEAVVHGVEHAVEAAGEAISDAVENVTHAISDAVANITGRDSEDENA